MVKRSLVILAVMVAPALADPPKIKDTVGFDWMQPKASKCTKVTGALLTKLTKSYTCTPAAPDRDTGSGVKLVATCKAKNGDSEFLLFSTAKDCATERDTQLANGG